MTVNWKEVSEIIRNFATVFGALLALFWFLSTRAYKRHAEVELSCRAFPLAGGTLAEISVIIENKGARRHKLARLTLCVERLKEGNAPGSESASKLEWQQLGNPETIDLNPEGRFVILQGISQEFTHTLLISRPTTLIRVTATFNAVASNAGVFAIPYPSKRTARRVFDLRVKGTDQTSSDVHAA